MRNAMWYLILTLWTLLACGGGGAPTCNDQSCDTRCQAEGSAGGSCLSGSCQCQGPADGDADSDGDADGDADGDSDADGDADSDGDADGDGAPGSACECDRDCDPVEGHRGVCVKGICMTVAAADCASSGSRDECPEGSRCWPLAEFDLQVCYPDCASNDCVGACDGQGSCIPTGDMNCDHECGSACTEPTCTPHCDGRQCGGDGCDGSCGECGDFQTCDDEAGQCQCGGGYLEFLTSEGAVHCCAASQPWFCESEARGPSCWTDEIDCASEIFCEGEWHGCHEDATAHCSSSDTFHCCPADHPVLCEADGYGAGCWPVEVDCSTLTFCEGRWRACTEDRVAICNEDDTFTCRSGG
jgi:hypothetical protein